MTEESERLWASRPAPHTVIQRAVILTGKARALICVGCILVGYALGMVSGVRLSSYRGQVADENYWEARKRLVVLEQFVTDHHPKALNTTKAQARVSAATIEKERRQAP